MNYIVTRDSHYETIFHCVMYTDFSPLSIFFYALLFHSLKVFSYGSLNWFHILPMMGLQPIAWNTVHENILFCKEKGNQCDTGSVQDRADRIYVANCGEQARRVMVRHLEEREIKRWERERRQLLGVQSPLMTAKEEEDIVLSLENK